jgi:hypothetical protein
MMFLRRRVFVSACVLLLSGCTGASFMGAEVSDYRNTFDTTGDEQILGNILRAKDDAPLHFSELQTLGASTQLTSSLQITDPFGARNGSTTRAGLQGTIGAQTTPTFSLSSLELQQFTQGLLNPVGPLVIQQFFEEGIDQRLLLMLFVSAITENQDIYYNSTKCDRAGDPEDCWRPFYRFLSEIDKLNRRGKIVARSYVELAPIGTSIPWPASTGVKDIVGIDPTKYSVEADANDPTKAIVYAISESRLALCYYRGTERGRGRYEPVLSGGDRFICVRDRVYANPDRYAQQWKNGVTIRSTYQIIEYLGQILKFQENSEHKNRCIQLGDEPPDHRTCAEGDILFQVNPAGEAPLVTTVYQGTPYAIGVGSCSPEHQDYCDHSSEVLKIVNLLININKSAANIPQVPIVRVVQ